MVSPYLQRPMRTLDEAIEDRARTGEGALDRTPVLPAVSAANSAVDRLDSFGALVRYLLTNPGANGTGAADARSAADGRRAA